MKVASPSLYPCQFIRLNPEADIGYGVRLLVEEDGVTLAKSALLISTVPDAKRGYSLLVDGKVIYASSHQMRMDHNAPGVAAELARFLVHALYGKPTTSHPAVFIDAKTLVIKGRQHTLAFSRFSSALASRNVDGYEAPGLRLSGVNVAVTSAVVDYLNGSLVRVQRAA